MAVMLVIQHLAQARAGVSTPHRLDSGNLAGHEGEGQLQMMWMSAMQGVGRACHSSQRSEIHPD